VSAPWWHPEANPLRDIREMIADMEFAETSALVLPERLEIPLPEGME
jgi:hypothetical protein